MSTGAETRVERGTHVSHSLPRQPGRESLALGLILSVPLLLFVSSLWMVRPFALGETLSLTLLSPAALVLAIVVVRVPRWWVLSRLRLFAVEFSLLTLIVLLSIVSMTNSEEPIRSFRIIYPSLLPMALFAHLAVVSYVAPERLEQVSRLAIICAFLFSVTPTLLSMVLPPLENYMSGAYRMRGFFENSIQHSIALGTIVPLMVATFADQRNLAGKVVWGLGLVLLAYTLFRAGSKSVLGLSFVCGVGLYVLLAIRSRSFGKIGAVAVGVTLMGIFIWLFGLTIAEQISPIMAGKIREIIEGGVSNYQSIESRKLLWDRAIEMGRENWLIGSGAGEKVLGISHAHNLVLDYFKGIGIFGAAAIALLCLTIWGRTLAKGLSLLAGRGDRRDVMVMACYLGASLYAFSNQLSDCFGPSTIGFLYVVYVTGRFLDGTRLPSGAPGALPVQHRI